MTGTPEQRPVCTDCGAELHGEFCSACGQRNISVNASIKELGKELGEELLSFDDKLFRSFPPFLYKPAFLVNEYLEGRRKRYISPFKLYFFLSFLFFFVGSLTPDPPAAPKGTSDNVVVDSVESNDDGDLIVSNKSGKFNIRGGNDSSFVSSGFGKILKGGLEKLQHDPEAFRRSFKERIPQFIFLLLPVFALLLKLLYVRRRMFYIAHLVFSFYLHSFGFLILLIIRLLELVGGTAVGGVAEYLVLLIPIYAVTGMSVLYHQSIFKTILKSFLLGSLYLVVAAALFVVGVLLLIVFM